MTDRQPAADEIRIVVEIDGPHGGQISSRVPLAHLGEILDELPLSTAARRTETGSRIARQLLRAAWQPAFDKNMTVCALALWIVLYPYDMPPGLGLDLGDLTSAGGGTLTINASIDGVTWRYRLQSSTVGGDGYVTVPPDQHWSGQTQGSA